MTIQEFYSRTGGDYSDVLRRLGNEARITKVLGMLPRDGSMAALSAAFEQRDCKAAFNAAHSLKGIMVNLGLANLTRSSSALTERLRSGTDWAEMQEQYNAVRKYYAEALDAVAELLSVDDKGREGADGDTKK